MATFLSRDSVAQSAAGGVAATSTYGSGGGNKVSNSGGGGGGNSNKQSNSGGGGNSNKPSNSGGNSNKISNSGGGGNSNKPSNSGSGNSNKQSSGNTNSLSGNTGGGNSNSNKQASGGGWTSGNNSLSGTSGGGSSSTKISRPASSISGTSGGGGGSSSGKNSSTRPVSLSSGGGGGGGTKISRPASSISGNSGGGSSSGKNSSTRPVSLSSGNSSGGKITRTPLTSLVGGGSSSDKNTSGGGSLVGSRDNRDPRDRAEAYATRTGIRTLPLGDQLGFSPVQGGRVEAPMFDAGYDARTGTMRMLAQPTANYNPMVNYPGYPGYKTDPNEPTYEDSLDADLAYQWNALEAYPATASTDMRLMRNPNMGPDAAAGMPGLSVFSNPATYAGQDTVPGRYTSLPDIDYLTTDMPGHMPGYDQFGRMFHPEPRLYEVAGFSGGEAMRFHPGNYEDRTGPALAPYSVPDPNPRPYPNNQRIAVEPWVPDAAPASYPHVYPQDPYPQQQSNDLQLLRNPNMGPGAVEAGRDYPSPLPQSTDMQLMRNPNMGPNADEYGPRITTPYPMAPSMVTADMRLAAGAQDAGMQFALEDYIDRPNRTMLPQLPPSVIEAGTPRPLPAPVMPDYAGPASGIRTAQPAASPYTAVPGTGFAGAPGMPAYAGSPAGGIRAPAADPYELLLEEAEQAQQPFPRPSRERPVDPRIVQTMLGEAAGEGDMGLAGVAQTFMNRAERYDMDPLEVVMERRGNSPYYQYSTWNAGENDGNNPQQWQPGTPAFERAEEIYRDVRDNAYDFTGGATHYFNPNVVNPDWADPNTPGTERLYDAIDIGDHRFLPRVAPGDRANINSNPALANTISAGGIGLDRPIPFQRPTQFGTADERINYGQGPDGVGLMPGMGGMERLAAGNYRNSVFDRGIGANIVAQGGATTTAFPSEPRIKGFDPLGQAIDMDGNIVPAGMWPAGQSNTGDRLAATPDIPALGNDVPVSVDAAGIPSYVIPTYPEATMGGPEGPMPANPEVGIAAAPVDVPNRAPRKQQDSEPSLWDNATEGMGKVFESTLLGGAIKAIFPEFWDDSGNSIRGWDDEDVGPRRQSNRRGTSSSSSEQAYSIYSESGDNTPKSGSRRGGGGGPIVTPVPPGTPIPPGPLPPPGTPGAPLVRDANGLVSQVWWPEVRWPGPLYEQGSDDEWDYLPAFARGGLVSKMAARPTAVQPMGDSYMSSSSSRGGRGKFGGSRSAYKTVVPARTTPIPAPIMPTPVRSTPMPPPVIPTGIASVQPRPVVTGGSRGSGGKFGGRTVVPARTPVTPLNPVLNTVKGGDLFLGGSRGGAKSGNPRNPTSTPVVVPVTGNPRAPGRTTYEGGDSGGSRGGAKTGNPRTGGSAGTPTAGGSPRGGGKFGGSYGDGGTKTGNPRTGGGGRGPGRVTPRPTTPTPPPVVPVVPTTPVVPTQPTVRFAPATYDPGVDGEWDYFPGFAEGGLIPDAGGSELPGTSGFDPRLVVIMNAEDALRGQHPDPQAALAEFVQTFGAKALEELRMRVEGAPSEDGPRLIQGPGGPKDDLVPAIIDGNQLAKLSNGEFVVPAEAVEAAGDGDPVAGAERLTQLSAMLGKK